MSIYKLRTELGHYFKWVLILVAVTVVVGTFFSFGPGTNLGGGESKGQEAVLAKVSLGNPADGVKITRGEFETMWQQYIDMNQQSGPQSPFYLAQMRSSLFSSLVQTKLALVAAAQEGVDVTNSAVDDQIEKYVTQYLKADRDLYIGRPGKNEKRPDDPRRDRQYIDALSSDGKSVRAREDFYRLKIPADQVRAELAIQGLQEKIKRSVPKPTDEEIKNSFNQNTVTMIAVIKSPDKPKEQIRNKAESYLKEANNGADFMKLAKESVPGTPMEKSGPTVTYSFDDRNKMPIEVRDKTEKLQPGQITPLIDTDYAYIIARLDSSTPKTPAPDPKALADRRKAIEDERSNTAMQDFQKKLTAGRNVAIYDSEMHGYWALSEAQQVMFTDPAKYKQKMDEATTALYHALNNPETVKLCASSMLAQLYFGQGKFKETALLLGGLLNGETRMAESADLRIMLGDSLVKIGKKDQAIDNYQIAMRMSKYNSANLEQVKTKFKDLGRTDLVKQTDALLVEQKKREAAAKALEQSQTPPPATTNKPPTGAKP